MKEKLMERWIPVILIVCIVTPGNIQAQAQSGKVGIHIEPEKGEVSSGEPIVMKLALINNSSSTVTFNTGPDDLAAFGFRILNRQRQIICEWKAVPGEGMNSIGREQVESGQTVARAVVVNKWCQKRLEPGVYRIEVSYEDFKDPSLVFRDRTSIDVGPYDELAIRKAITQAYDELSRSHENSARTRLLVEKIAYCQDAGAVEYIQKILENKVIFYFVKQDAVLGLGGICTVKAAEVLAGLMANTELRFQVLQAAIRMNSSIRPEMADNEKIRRALQPVLDLDPRRNAIKQK
jgi:hypothetical protein